jgi:hypothetical protein
LIPHLKSVVSYTKDPGKSKGNKKLKGKEYWPGKTLEPGN